MLGRHDHRPHLKQFARELRTQSTDAERKLWTLLRDKQLEGFRFRRQHPIAGYIVDFVCTRAGLVVELDGGQHTEADAVAYDAQRTENLGKLNLRVLRFQDDEVLRNPDAVIETIYRELTQKNPHPNPLPDYREREYSAGDAESP